MIISISLLFAVPLQLMVLSCLFFLDLKGKVLISRDYRGDISASHADKFMDLLLERELSATAEDYDVSVERVQPPVFTHDGITYCYVKYNNLYCKFASIRLLLILH